jgi:SAM-dependent methyltransferase
MGRWSRVLAGEFLNWLRLPEDLSWLEVGCGTGSLSGEIIKRKPRELLSVDPSSKFIEYASRRHNHRSIDFKQGGAENLPAGSDRYDVVISGLVLNFIPDPAQAIREMRRVIKSGGLVCGYVWDYAGKMDMLRYFWDAVVLLDPEAENLDQGIRFSICQPDPITTLLKDAGLNHIAVEPVLISMHFRDFDDFWLPFLGGQGTAPGYLQNLSPEQQDELRASIFSRLPINAGGSLDLAAQAWGFRAQKAASA